MMEVKHKPHGDDDQKTAKAQDIRNLTDDMIRALIEGPDRKDRENGVRSPLPGAITEDDVLGIAAEGDTLLVNLSDSFRQGIREHGPEKEAIVCYSMVNTLCLNSVLRRVCFFFEGVQEEKIAGEIYWAGTFMYNPQI